MKKITRSEKQTQVFGKKFASQLIGGEVVCLYGNLGAGKTSLVKGIAKGFGIKRPIVSPTFVLMKNYRIANNKLRIKNLIHIDAYRIHSHTEIADLGFHEFTADKNTVTVIEWAEKIKKILPKRRIDIFMKFKKIKQRVLDIRYKKF